VFCFESIRFVFGTKVEMPLEPFFKSNYAYLTVQFICPFNCSGRVVPIPSYVREMKLALEAIAGHGS
jgi:hypothetical protein